MDTRLPITVLLAVRNEAANMPRCLAAIGPAERVIALDSHSTDGTPDLARAAGAEVVQFDYRGGYPKKRQWALERIPLSSPWVLLLDADEVVTPALWEEMGRTISRPDACDGYLVRKGFHFLGRRFRFGGFSFSAVLLFRRGKAHFERTLASPEVGLDMEVHERLVVEGRVGVLREPLLHEDFKGLAAYLDRHNRYSTWEALLRHQYFRTGRWGEETIIPRLFGNTQEQRRFLKSLVIRLPCEAWLWFAYHYFLRLGFLEGRAGLIASQIRAQYIANVRAKVYELRQRAKTLPM